MTITVVQIIGHLRAVMYKLGLTDYFIIQNVPKLRSYKRFKHSFDCEQYVVTNLKKYERSILCQFRCSILPTRLEDISVKPQNRDYVDFVIRNPLRMRYIFC